MTDLAKTKATFFTLPELGFNSDHDQLRIIYLDLFCPPIPISLFISLYLSSRNLCEFLSVVTAPQIRAENDSAPLALALRQTLDALLKCFVPI